MLQNAGVVTEKIDVTQLIDQLLKHSRLLITYFFLGICIAIIYILAVKPTYRADALIQVEKKNSGALLTPSLDSLFEGSMEASDEIELLHSRKVLSPVVRDLGLTVEIKPVYFPLIGEFIARLTQTPPTILQLSDLSISPELKTDQLLLRVIDENSYKLFYNDIDLFDGKVGQTYMQDGVKITVTKISAQPGDTFSIKQLNEIEVIGELSQKLKINSEGRGSSIFHISYDGEDPQQIKQVVNGVINSYQHLDLLRQSEEINTTLQFLDKKLPEIFNVLKGAEDKLNNYRQNKESVNFELETKLALDAITQLESQLQGLQLKENELSKLYTSHHPLYRSLREQISSLENKKNQLNDQISKMPEVQQEMLRLMREVQANQDSYVSLLNRQQELRVLRAGIIGNVRIVDEAVTQPNAVAPKKGLILVLGGLGGLLVGLGFVVLWVARNRKIDSITGLEKTGLNVIAALPVSEWLRRQEKRRISGSQLPILAQVQPDCVTIEALRSLRTSLHFKMINSNSRTVMLTSASPGAGKSFISLNLAVVASEGNHKVLLIDADMRKGNIHRLLGLKDDRGLTNYLAGILPIEDVIQKSVNELDVITCGIVDITSTDLLMHDRFKSLLQWAEQEYSMIIIDTPPVLAISDALLVGHLTAINIVIARYSFNTIHEIELTKKYFETNHVPLSGCILNAYDETKELGNIKYQYSITTE